MVVERMPGLDFYLDPSLIDAKEAERVRTILAAGHGSAGKAPGETGGIEPPVLAHEWLALQRC